MPPRPQDELETLFRQLREQAPPPAAATVAAHLPTRVAALLRDEEAAAEAPRFLRSLAWFAPLTVACALWAVADLLLLSPQAITSPEVAAWMAALFA